MLRRLQFALVPLIPAAVLIAVLALQSAGGGSGGGRDYLLRIELPPAGGRIGLPKVEGPPDASRPLVVLDPGHGGHDPGAGKGTLKEKMLTLRLAKALRDELLKNGGIRVALTRDDDRYLMLAERSSIARRLKADLFLSIHADSVDNDGARGASVYTLSERGTSEVAAKFAVRENQADTVNGIELSMTSDTVSNILLDLSQREAQGNSDEFARLILREIQGRMPLHDPEVQSAAFAVLKSPDLPSVLFETGYISNERDATFLSSPKGQQTFARSTARAIRVYFARRTGV
ncbi:MAG: N-acetylmuramoyl-L-alanine amidase [Novosphingobium sp.]